MLYLVLMYGLSNEAKADLRYKYNHSFVPSVNAETQIELQNGFSLGATPFAQGPLLTASYTYLGKKQLGIGLEQVMAKQYSVRAQLLYTDDGYGVGGQLFWHLEPEAQSDNTHVEYGRKTEAHHGALISGGLTSDDWWLGIGYQFGFGNMNFKD